MRISITSSIVELATFGTIKLRTFLAKANQKRAIDLWQSRNASERADQRRDGRRHAASGSGDMAAESPSLQLSSAKHRIRQRLEAATKTLVAHRAKDDDASCR